MGPMDPFSAASGDKLSAYRREGISGVISNHPSIALMAYQRGMMVGVLNGSAGAGLVLFEPGSMMWLE